MLKQIFLGTTKFVGEQKNLGGTAPECPPWLRAWKKCLVAETQYVP